MRHALHAEWTKLRTVAGTGWVLACATGLTVVVGTIVALSISYASLGAGQDITRLSLTGIYLGQVIIAMLAVQVIAGEYGSGMIHVTLTATPRRRTVLVAKAAITGALVLAAGSVAVLGSVLAGRLILPANGFTATHGYAPLSLSHGATLRAAGGSVIYLALVALLSLGIATVVRDTAIAIGIVLGLLFVFPIIANLFTDPALRRHLQQIGPMSAGLAIQDTTNLRALPIAPWAGLGVLAAWATGAMVAGGLFLRLRDA